MESSSTSKTMLVFGGIRPNTKIIINYLRINKIVFKTINCVLRYLIVHNYLSMQLFWLFISIKKVKIVDFPFQYSVVSKTVTS